jgi:chorismate dehydratase
MDFASQFFKKQQPIESCNENAGKVTACFTDQLYHRPLLYGIEKKLVPQPMQLDYTTQAESVIRLLQGLAELAIIPSIAYAQGKGSWKIIPDICVAWSGSVQSASLFFNKTLAQLNTISIDEESQSESALLKVILMEKYEIEPVYITMKAEPEAMLKQADAALITGSRSLVYRRQNKHFLDLGEEWYDLTGLPFVHSLCAGNEILDTSGLQTALQASSVAGSKHLEEICREFSDGKDLDDKLLAEHLIKDIHFSLGMREKEGLTEFFRYAFFFGLIEHLPDLHFF